MRQRYSTMATLFTLFLLKVLIIEIHCLIEKTSELQIPQGKLVGLVTDRGNVRQYLGIPYGSVNERFQEAGPPPQWLGVFNAIDPSIVCAQYIERLSLPTGIEDCLILNVHTPGQVNYKRLYPVMVFIHGGGYRTGSSTTFLYDPRFLVKKGVIVVTVNYRLGAFGFLCLRINGAPGNIGLKDQIAALKWVQDNIRYFGGNPNAVTIFGESAGSSSVSHLILSPATKGLYKRAIMESASALSPFAFASDPIERAAIVATKLGYNTKNPFELLKIFKNATKNEILIASEEISKDNLLSEKYIFRLCAEKKSIGTKPFLTTSPQELLNSGTYNKVPMIIGYNNKEGILYAPQFDKQQYQNLNVNFAKILPDNLYFSNNGEKNRTVHKVKSFYFGNKTIDEQSVGNLIDFISDTMFHYPSAAMNEYFLKHNHGMPIFNYYFKYDSNRNLAKILMGQNGQKGAAHGDELFYLFEPIIFLPLPTVGDDRTVVDRMTSMWTNFAKFGNPTVIKSETLNVEWTASDKDEVRYLNIDKSLTMGPLPNPERIELWKSIYHSNPQV